MVGGLVSGNPARPLRGHPPQTWGRNNKFWTPLSKSGVEVEAASEVGGEDCVGVEGEFEFSVGLKVFWPDGLGEMFRGEG